MVAKLHSLHTLIVALSCTAALTLAAVATAAPDESETQRELSQARSSSQSLREQIAVTSAQVERLQAPIARLDARLSGLQRELARRQRRLVVLERELTNQAAQIARLERQLTLAQLRLTKRLVVIYKDGDTRALAAFLGSESLSDLVGRQQAARLIAETDHDVVREVDQLERKVEAARAETASLHAEARQEARQVRSARDEVASARSELVRRQRALSQVVSERSAQLQSTQAREALLEDNLAQLEAASAQLEQAISSAPAISAAPPATASPETSSPTLPPPPAPPVPAASSASLIWPVNGPIVSSYGPRSGGMHYGIDIAAPSGTPTVAAASGAVIYSGWMDGYGNLVVVQHGGGLSTAYAHLSRIGAANGQAVARGQVIGYVGCTGRCFGDHVHFETRLNGSAVDPMNYL